MIPRDAGGPSALGALNTALVMPADDEEIMRGMYERFEELAKAGGGTKVP